MTEHTMVKKQSKVPLSCPIFTEETQRMRQGKLPAQPWNEKVETYLFRLEKMLRLTGKATIQMMEEFKCFPETKNTVLMVGQSNVTWMEYLEVYVEVDEERLEK